MKKNGVQKSSVVLDSCLGVPIESIELKSVAKNVVEIENPLILKETSKTRRCFFGKFVREEGQGWELKGCITHERMSETGTWEPTGSEKLTTLKAGEIRKLELSRDEVCKLSAGLNALIATAKNYAVNLDNLELVVAKKQEVIHVDEAQKAAIQSLIDQGHGGDVWKMLSSMQPDLAAQLADADLLRRRKKAVEEFEKELSDDNWNELSWESYFNANRWIFGLGLRFQLLKQLQN